MHSNADRKNHRGLLFSFLRGSKAMFVASILLSAVSTLCEQLNPQIIRAAIDNAVGGRPSQFPEWVNAAAEKLGGFAYLGENLWIMALLIVAVSAVRTAAQYGTSMFNSAASEVLVKRMRDTLFARIQRLPYSWHMKNHTGDMIQRCTTDVDRIRTFVAEQLTSVLRIGIMALMSLYFMFSMNARMAAVAVIPIPVILFYSVVFRREMQEGFTACEEYEGTVSSIVQENLTGVRVVRAFAGERRERDRFMASNQHYTDLWVRMGHVIGRFFSVQDVLCGMQILAVTVFGAVFAVEGSISPGEYVAFLSYNAMLSFPIRRLGRMLSEMSKAGVSLDRLAYIMDAEEEKDSPSAQEADMTGDICFEHISFSYEGGPQILKDVSFTAKAGSTLGILGGTGSGKSTLMLLLDRMYDLPEGCGRISIGGKDIRDIKLEHLRKNIAMVLQEPYLFSRTLKQNIGIAREGISEEEIEAAARAACIHQSIEGFADGYETFVGERGVTLSGGQRQRTAIARALTAGAPIMVFDDSLSAVDSRTDAKIRAALEERFGSATVIIISHRITTLAKADRVIVLEDGRISEQGTPQELKESGGIYSRIYSIQAGIAQAAEAEKSAAPAPELSAPELSEGGKEGHDA